jgi:hypothetical protein
MNAVATPQPYEVPEGGLASFLTSTVGDWSDEALNSDTYYDIVKPTAEQLAEFGREEDDHIAHVATGETVVPLAVFEEDPALKEALFARMRDMGIEPERYVVGNELNSINPVTGQPEFFLKKLFKGVKKAVKGVVKVFKKIAPIVLSIGLAMTPLGLIAGSALGSGIGTLIQGGNLKDAFKSALISGVTAGVGQGIAKGFSAASAGSATGLGNIGEFASGFGQSISSIPTQFTEGVGTLLGTTAATPADVQRAAQLAKGPAANPEVLAKAGAPTLAEAPAFQQVSAYSPISTERSSLSDIESGPLGEGFKKEVITSQPSDVLNESTVSAQEKPPTVSATPKQVAAQASSSSALAKDLTPGFFDSLRTAVTQKDFGAFLDAFMPGELTPESVIDWFKTNKGLDISLQDAVLVAEKASPGIMRSYLPLLGLGTVGLGALGGFKPGPQPEPYDFFAGMDRTPYQFAFPGSQFRGAAGGGEMTNFPRKNGAILGPGTETSDDIPAMLSDGEFVMTARAVRGAGDGSRQDGMKRMYDIMRSFEGRAARV